LTHSVYKAPGVQRPHITGQPRRTSAPNWAWLHQLGGQPGLALHRASVLLHSAVKQIINNHTSLFQWRRQGEAAGVCAPAGNPRSPGCEPAYKPSSIVFASHSTVFCTPTEAEIFSVHGIIRQDFNDNFQKKISGSHQWTFFGNLCRRDYLTPHPPQRGAQVLQCWNPESRLSGLLRSYGASLVPQQTPGAANGLFFT